MKKTHVYIIGSKGIPAKYGGFETFVEKLTENQVDQKIQYHVACMTDNSAKSGITDKHFIYNNADCFNISVPNIGSAKAIYYDVAAINYAIELAKKNNDIEPVFYVLACRIGPFIAHIKEKIKNINGKLFVNPDGHEWLRAKWSYPIRRYWKLSERLMVKYADLLICDSKHIEKYIKEEYKEYHPNTVYIAYGTDISKSDFTQKSADVLNWYKENKIKNNEYYLVVGRFVPENNYEAMIKEFMQSNTNKDLVLVTNVEHNKFYEKLRNETHFDRDSRVKFVGTVYNQELLKYIRDNAFAYIHGHEVGGTNPSLLEALAATKINLLLDVGFNREVAEEGALYWTKKDGDLATSINQAEKISKEQTIYLSKISSQRIAKNYSWQLIANKYNALFLTNYTN